MKLDVQTLFTAITLAYFSGGLLLGLMAVALRSIDRDIRFGWGLWSFAMILSSCCAMLFGLRGEVPDILSIVLANALLIIAFGIRPTALGLINGKQANYYWLPIIGTVGWLGLYSMTWFREDLFARVLYVNGYCFLATALCIWESWKLDRRQISAWFLIGAFSVDLVIRGSLIAVHMQKQFPDLLAGYQTIPLKICMLALLVAVIFKTAGVGISVFEILKRQYQKEAQFDPLTGLPNRRGFERDVKERLRSQSGKTTKHYALVVMDVDGLAGIEERFGHSMEEAYMKLLAKITSQSIFGAIQAARFRDGQIALFVPDADLNKLYAITKRISQTMTTESRNASAEKLATTVSSGAFFGNAGTDYARALEVADHCLRMAKAEGGNRIVVNENLNDEPIKVETLQEPFATRARQLA